MKQSKLSFFFMIKDKNGMNSFLKNPMLWRGKFIFNRNKIVFLLQRKYNCNVSYISN